MAGLLSRRAFCASAAIAAVSAACSLAGCSSGAKGEKTGAGNGESSKRMSTIKVCTDGVFDYTLCGYYIARISGLFSDEGLEVVEEKPAANATKLESVNAGNARICFASQDELAPMYATDEPASIEAVAALVQARDAEEGYRHLVVANDLFLVKHEEHAWAFLRALEAGYRFCVEQTVEAAHVISEHFDDVQLEACLRQLQSIAESVLDTNGLWGTIDTGIWDAKNARLLEAGAISIPIYTHHGFNLDYLPCFVNVAS